MSEKMFITKTPALPSKCAVCYTDAKGEQDFIDFGADLDYYGAILICDLCIVNAAKLVGMVPVAKLEEAERRADIAVEAAVISNKKVASLEYLLSTYGLNSNLNDSFGDSTLFDPEVELQATETPDKSADDGAGKKPKSSKSATV